MAIITTLQTRFFLQKILMVVMCLVLGLWGVYDYAVKIPAQATAYQRGQVALLVKQALEAEPQSPSARERIELAAGALEAERARLGRGAPSAARSDAAWGEKVDSFSRALEEARRRSPAGGVSKEYQVAYETTKAIVNETANISPPSKFDRATQWAFIACLPFVPWALWTFVAARRRVYRLDDDGTLHGPGLTWTGDEIADIDMSRWMAKSVATIVHRDGERVRLDDYVYKHAHLIVGAIASRRHPDEWDADARPVKPGEGEGGGGDAPAGEAEAPAERTDGDT